MPYFFYMNYYTLYIQVLEILWMVSIKDMLSYVGHVFRVQQFEDCPKTRTICPAQMERFPYLQFSLHRKWWKWRVGRLLCLQNLSWKLLNSAQFWYHLSMFYLGTWKAIFPSSHSNQLVIAIITSQIFTSLGLEIIEVTHLLVYPFQVL